MQLKLKQSQRVGTGRFIQVVFHMLEFGFLYKWKCSCPAL